MDQVSYYDLLRVLHISGAVFWAGATIYLACFVMPASNAAGPENKKLMEQLAKRDRLPLVMNITAITTVISACILLWELSAGLEMEWLKTKPGVVLSLGAITSVIGFFTGFFINRPAVARIARIGHDIAKAGGPTIEQLQLLGNVRKKLSIGTRFMTVLLGISIIALSIARYV